MITLKNKDYILLDGAFGTYYALQSGDSAPCELACIDNPAAVSSIHRAYLSAGANGIKTNTFAANTLSLGVDFSTVEAVIRAAFGLARVAVAGSGAAVFADIGPIPNSETEEYYRIIDCFLAEGAENFLFETMNSLEIFELADYVKSKANCFVIASFAVGQDGYTTKGISVKDIFARAELSTVDALGLNCAPPSTLLQLFGAVSSTKILAASPNASYPSDVGGRAVFQDNARYYAEKLAEIHGAGVKILGGCCGTTPLHITETAKLLAVGNAVPARVSRQVTVAAEQAMRNRFAEKLLSGERVIAVELDPPPDTDFSHIRMAVPALKAAGADVITLADNPLARARADSTILSAKVQREEGIATMPHMSCRDRNTLGIKSALLGASIEAVQNLLIVTGDPVLSVDRSETKGVFSMNSYELIKYVDNLNRDIFTGRTFFTGGALNVNAVNFAGELARAEKKQASGAKFFLTQPIFDERALENLSLAKKTLSAKILAGLMPIVSYKNAMFLNNEVVGIEVPLSLICAIKDRNAEEVAAISLEFSLCTAKKALPFCDGFYLCTPLKRYDLIVRLISGIKNL